MVREESECHIRHTFPYHQVHHDERLEDDCPCRIAETILEDAEYFADASFAGMGRYEDVLDVLRFGRRELRTRQRPKRHLEKQKQTRAQLTLILVAPLTDFSNDSGMFAGKSRRRELRGWCWRWGA